MANKLEMQISEVMEGLNPPQRELVDGKVESICYSRMECAMLGVDYNSLPRDDMTKIYHHVMRDLGYMPSE